MNTSFKLIAIFLGSLLYWLYLATHTHMVIEFDSISYQQLGLMLKNQGWIEYFKSGPNREPVYPMLISWAMWWADLSSMSYTFIMALMGVVVLAVSQFLLHVVLRILNIRHSIIMAALVYFAISPAITNSALSLYSEMATYPLVLACVLILHYLFKAVREDRLMTAWTWSVGLGLICAGLTFVKAVFECAIPVFLVIVCLIMLRNNSKRIAAFICMLLAAGFFAAPILAYKSMNLHFNGHFVVTNRGPWALYGNTTRRMEPLTVKKFLAALAYAPGEGVCQKLFGPQECDFWSYKTSDDLGMAKLGELSQRLDSSQVDAQLISLSIEQAKHNPWQYALMTAVESIKMFFWESTQIGFVTYPGWLTKLYSMGIFKDGVRLVVGLLTMAAFGFCLWSINRQNNILISSILVLTSLTVVLYALFFILTRYALPLAPLYLVCMAYAAQCVLPKNRT